MNFRKPILIRKKSEGQFAKVMRVGVVECCVLIFLRPCWRTALPAEYDAPSHYVAYWHLSGL